MVMLGHQLLWPIIAMNLGMLWKKRFPNSCLLLCIFHMLQQVWRWFYDRLHNIWADDRVEIMKKFRQILSCKTEVELQKMCDQFFNLIKKYRYALIYFSDLFLSKQEWAVCYINNSLLRGSNTNNYVEAQFLVGFNSPPLTSI